METWSTRLSDQERQQLRTYLPQGDHAGLTSLFGREQLALIPHRPPDWCLRPSARPNLAPALLPTMSVASGASAARAVCYAFVRLLHVHAMRPPRIRLLHWHEASSVALEASRS